MRVKVTVDTYITRGGDLYFRLIVSRKSKYLSFDFVRCILIYYFLSCNLKYTYNKYKHVKTLLLFRTIGKLESSSVKASLIETLIKYSCGFRHHSSVMCHRFYLLNYMFIEHLIKKLMNNVKTASSLFYAAGNDQCGSFKVF